MSLVERGECNASCYILTTAGLVFSMASESMMELFVCPTCKSPFLTKELLAIHEKSHKEAY